MRWPSRRRIHHDQSAHLLEATPRYSASPLRWHAYARLVRYNGVESIGWPEGRFSPWASRAVRPSISSLPHRSATTDPEDPDRRPWVCAPKSGLDLFLGDGSAMATSLVAYFRAETSSLSMAPPKDCNEVLPCGRHHVVILHLGVEVGLELEVRRRGQLSLVHLLVLFQVFASSGTRMPRDPR